VPTDSTHLDYDANLNAWLRAREVFAGEDAVKAAKERFLLRLDTQTDEEYAAYKERASFFNATARTVDGFVGLIFRREPVSRNGNWRMGSLVGCTRAAVIGRLVAWGRGDYYKPEMNVASPVARHNCGCARNGSAVRTNVVRSEANQRCGCGSETTRPESRPPPRDGFGTNVVESVLGNWRP
jgi:hypothetical protein